MNCELWMVNGALAVARKCGDGDVLLGGVTDPGPTVGDATRSGLLLFCWLADEGGWAPCAIRLRGVYGATG